MPRAHFWHLYPMKYTGCTREAVERNFLMSLMMAWQSWRGYTAARAVLFMPLKVACNTPWPRTCPWQRFVEFLEEKFARRPVAFWTGLPVSSVAPKPHCCLGLELPISCSRLAKADFFQSAEPHEFSSRKLLFLSSWRKASFLTKRIHVPRQ